MSTNLPTGTVTFLFTDIEGSTKLAQTHAGKWETLRARHHTILESAINSNNGYVFQIIGDAFCASFHTAGDAVRAATQSQIDLYKENWGDAPVKVRMGIHTGEAELQDDGQYHGYLDMSRIQRLMSAGHGGQVLISHATEELVRDELSENIILRDMGERRFKDLVRPERVHQLVIANLPADFPPLKTLDAYRHNLPVQLTSFIGRKNDLVNIAQIIKGHRLITLTGVGGTGKTRLALQVAADLLEEFKDGTWLVELAPVADPKLVPQTIISTLQLYEVAGRTAVDTITDFLESRKALLLLDNCEHLIQECAEFSNHLLHKCTQLKILATSREPLNIMGEMILSVPSLTTPQIDDTPSPDALRQFEAVNLFLERARSIQPTFELNQKNAKPVAQICARLDGIPLALELAAARVRGLGVDQIASRLDHRFRLLTGGRTAMQRQQTLGATVDWSYNLLTDAEKQLFQMLAVFIGPFTLQAVEEVCHLEGIDSIEMLELTQRLVDKSMVIPEERYGETYYRLLETIRQYGRDKLLASEKTELLANRHAKYFMSLAQQGCEKLRGSDQIHWTHHFILMQDNFRAALTWIIETKETETALHFVCNLYEFWLRHSDFEEARKWFSQILSMPDAQQLYPEAYIKALNRLAWTHRLQGRIKEAKVLCEQALTLAQSINSKTGIADALINLGVILVSEDDFVKAQSCEEEARDLRLEIQDEWGYAVALMDLGVVHVNQNLIEEARSTLNLSFDIFRRHGDIGFQVVVKWIVGNFEVEQNNIAEGVRAYCDSLLVAQKLESPLNIARNFFGLANAAMINENYARAIRLYMAGKKVYESIGAFAYANGSEENLAPARIALDKATFDSAAEQGYAMSTERAIDYALEARNA